MQRPQTLRPDQKHHGREQQRIGRPSGTIGAAQGSFRKPVEFVAQCRRLIRVMFDGLLERLHAGLTGGGGAEAVEVNDEQQDDAERNPNSASYGKCKSYGLGNGAPQNSLSPLNPSIECKGDG